MFCCLVCYSAEEQFTPCNAQSLECFSLADWSHGIGVYSKSSCLWMCCFSNAVSNCIEKRLYRSSVKISQDAAPIAMSEFCWECRKLTDALLQCTVDSLCDVLKGFPALVVLRAGSWKGMEQGASLHTVHSDTAADNAVSHSWVEKVLPVSV